MRMPNCSKHPTAQQDRPNRCSPAAHPRKPSYLIRRRLKLKKNRKCPPMPKRTPTRTTSATRTPWPASIAMTRLRCASASPAPAASDDPVPHLPSIERWRAGDHTKPYDPNTEASRQEMRSFVCGQCHVEYYCATKETL